MTASFSLNWIISQSHLLALAILVVVPSSLCFLKQQQQQLNMHPRAGWRQTTSWQYHLGQQQQQQRHGTRLKFLCNHLSWARNVAWLIAYDDHHIVMIAWHFTIVTTAPAGAIIGGSDRASEDDWCICMHTGCTRSRALSRPRLIKIQHFPLWHRLYI